MSLAERIRTWLQQPIAPAPAEPVAPVEPPIPVLTDRAPDLPANAVDPGRLRAQLVLHEGERRLRYRDSEGHWTIGIGRNLDARPFNAAEMAVIGAERDLDRFGLNRREIDMLYARDVSDAVRDLDRFLSWWRGLDEVRRRVLVDMMFNMGPGDSKRGVLSFVNTLAAIRGRRFADAAAGLRASKWAAQTKTRADRLIAMMETGRDWVS